ncbi:MAG TPA: hypothetical protein PKK05_27425, partial [Leptospiraceae bacterium]|nr:hypothetical protein [Leptospiraceae bacterium]
IIGRSASLNYGFSTGNSNFNLNANDYYSTSLMYLRQKEFEAKRTDQDLSLSILLSDTGFYIFGGLKAQSYTYDISDNPSFAIGTSNGQIFAGSPRLSLSKPNSKINFVSYGPAAGLGYTKALTNRLSISASVGMIYMFSYYQQNGLAFIVDGGTGGTGNTVSLVKTRDTQQSIKIGGYTFSLNFNFLLGNGILQLGLIKQEAQLTSMMNDYLMYSFGPKGPSVDWGSFLIKQMLNINEKDVFQGITLGYQHKLSD